ncbi:MAG: pyruvate kinase [Myxococcota bacterium]|nr:pyruvate kinase [Myxococcota bacterium]
MTSDQGALAQNTSLPGFRTKIVCTLGPASASAETMTRMIDAGMNVARLNFSHGDLDGHGRMIEAVRGAAAAAGRHVAILADLPGPKIRLGELVQPVELVSGDAITLTTEAVVGDAARASVSFAELPQVVHVGGAIYLNDGSVQLEVEAIEGTEVRCRVLTGGEIGSRKGVNLPGARSGIAAFTAHDRECLRFALAHGVDVISQSFVETRADVDALRAAAAELGCPDIFVIAKIERANALANIGEILDAADAIMIARGDLGVETAIERIALVQKQLARLGHERGKPA